MTFQKKSNIIADVTCPFCSLLCDDLVLRNYAGKLSIKKNDCPKAVHGFERIDPDISPRIHGNDCTLEDAIGHAANIMSNARQPIITGLGTDINGSRAAMLLAETTGSIIDHSHSNGMMSNALILQTSGWMLTTLSELKNRADLIVFIGTDASTNYPRFFERFIWDQDSLAGLKKNNRDCVFIGNKLNTRLGIKPNGGNPTVISCSDESLSEIIGLLRALVNGVKIKSSMISGKKLTALKNLSERLKNAKYGVFVWAAGEFSQSYAELTVHAICELTKELNLTTRFSGLPLGGNNGGISFSNVCTWQSGYPMRVNYSAGHPDYDPHNFSTSEALKNTESDAMLWISSFDSDLSPPVTSVPTIILSRPSKRLALDTEIYIPVATPGLDHPGNLSRTDSVVTLPLKQIRDTHLPSVSETLNRIHQSL